MVGLWASVTIAQPTAEDRVQLTWLTPGPAAVGMSQGQAAESLRLRLPMIGSTLVQQKLAEHLGVRNILGKTVARPERPDPDSHTEVDGLVSGGPISLLGQQNSPTIAVNPVDSNIVVVAGNNTSSLSGDSNDCSIYLSVDAGKTYSYFDDVPLPGPLPHFCSDPVARFAPDGSQLYVSYIETAEDHSATVVWVASYAGFDIAAGALSLIGFGATAPDLIARAWIDVHTFDTTGNGAEFLYLSFTFLTPSNCEITFARLGGYGTSVDVAPQPLAVSDTCGGLPALSTRLLQGSRPAAGPQQQVLVCWYDAGTDGWSTGAAADPFTPTRPNRFNVACRSSNDRGLTFAGDTAPPEADPPDLSRWIYAAKNVANEVAFYLGPNATYFALGAAAFQP